MTNQPTVTDDPERCRYEATDESGMVVGFADYQKREGRLIFTHTEVDPAFQGRGIGTELVRGALDHAATTGLPVRAACKFVKAFLDDHPEYRELMAPRAR